MKRIEKFFIYFLVILFVFGVGELLIRYGGGSVILLMCGIMLAESLNDWIEKSFFSKKEENKIDETPSSLPISIPKLWEYDQEWTLRSNLEEDGSVTPIPKGVRSNELGKISVIDDDQ